MNNGIHYALFSTSMKFDTTILYGIATELRLVVEMAVIFKIAAKNPKCIPLILSELTFCVKDDTIYCK